MVYDKVVNGLKFLKSKQQFRANKTFIIPTAFGFAFGAVSFVLLIMAIGYANNLLYFFVFLLISMALTGMRMTNTNVDSLDIEIDQLKNTALFANEMNDIKFLFINKNSKKTYLWNIEVSFDLSEKNKPQKQISMINEIQDSCFMHILWSPKQRGISKLPRIRIESRFPYQMLRAWKFYDPKSEVIIYPERKGILNIPEITHADLKQNRAQQQKQNQQLAEEESLFRDYRDYQTTDSPLRIDWRRSLKHQKHLVKNFETTATKNILIDWNMANFVLNFEDRISQVAIWVDHCHKKNNPYSLKINSDQTEFSKTETHYRKCLEKLARLQESDVL